MGFLTIHDIRKEYFKLDLNRFRLTFDDGLFSQYYYCPLFSNYETERIYFITTSFIKPGKIRKRFEGEYTSYLKSKKYMCNAFVEKDFDHFMTMEELMFLSTQKNVVIGAHSHYHDVIATRQHPRKKKPLGKWKLERFQNSSEILDKDLCIRSRLAFQGFSLANGKLMPRSESKWEEYIMYDTEKCLKWFESNLGLVPDMYSFPFNEYSEKLISILRSFGFQKFFGARAGKRSDIEARKDIDSLIDHPKA